MSEVPTVKRQEKQAQGSNQSSKTMSSYKEQWPQQGHALALVSQTALFLLFHSCPKISFWNPFHTYILAYASYMHAIRQFQGLPSPVTLDTLKMGMENGNWPLHRPMRDGCLNPEIVSAFCSSKTNSTPD